MTFSSAKSLSSVFTTVLMVFGTRCQAVNIPAIIDTIYGATTGSLQHGGKQRSWKEYVPSELVQPVRIVMDLHGHNGAPWQQMLFSGWLDIAKKDGFVVVFPEGLADLVPDDPGPSFNAGNCCGGASDKKVDDVGFLRKVAEEVAKKHGVDLHKDVHWSGLSNGGAMVQRMAAEANDIVASVGAFSQYLVLDPAEFPTETYKKKQVPIIEVHGVDDLVVLFKNWTAIKGWTYGAHSNFETWSTHNGCPKGTHVKKCKGSDYDVFFHPGCASGTEVASLAVASGHLPYMMSPSWFWNPIAAQLALGNVQDQVASTHVAWNFMKRYPVSEKTSVSSSSCSKFEKDAAVSFSFLSFLVFFIMPLAILLCCCSPCICCAIAKCRSKPSDPLLAAE